MFSEKLKTCIKQLFYIASFDHILEILENVDHVYLTEAYNAIRKAIKEEQGYITDLMTKEFPKICRYELESFVAASTYDALDCSNAFALGGPVILGILDKDGSCLKVKNEQAADEYVQAFETMFKDCLDENLFDMENEE